jgi:hypothetical protein
MSYNVGLISLAHMLTPPSLLFHTVVKLFDYKLFSCM